jgi:hypothetical protein
MQTNNVPAHGVVVGGSAPVISIMQPPTSGGAIIGGTAVNSLNRSHEVCTKDPLPLHPRPSKANYASTNVAPLIDFFVPIVNSVLGESLDHCQMEFRYENNSPCNPNDDIIVVHPDCIGIPYTPPGPHPCNIHNQKSKELLAYEKVAKKSARLKAFEQASPAHIEYFHDVCFS